MSKRYFILASLVTMLLALSLTAGASPVSPVADGDLDPTFSDDGKVITPFLTVRSGAAYAVAVQADGKVFAAGQADESYSEGFAMTRYNTDGSLDATFGVDGWVKTKLSGEYDRINAIAVQPDGKIIAAGYADITISDSYGDFAAVRYNPDGTLDTTFSGDGKLVISLDVGQDLANAVVVQPDGKIILGGTDGYWPGDHFALVRLNADGSLDETFDADGIVLTGIGSSTVYALALQPNGKIVAAGSSRLGDIPQFALARYMPDGSLDTTFDTDGKVTISMGDTTGPAEAIAISGNGKITVAGHAVSTGSPGFFALARFLADGSLDPSFDGDGKVTTPFDEGSSYATSLVLQADGKLVAGGYVDTGTSTAPDEFALARYLTDGSLDTSFDEDGKVTTTFPQSGSTKMYDMAVAPGGELIAAGATAASVNYAFGLARYSADGALDSGFGTGGLVITPIFYSDAEARAVAIQPNGKVVVAGRAYLNLQPPAGCCFALARYNADGSPDTSFGSGGSVTINMGDTTSEAYALGLQSDGRIVVAGSAFNATSGRRDFAVARLNVDGTLDTDFGTGGRVLTEIDGSRDGATSMIIQPDGKIVALGSDLYSHFVLVRYNTDGTLYGGPITTSVGSGAHANALMIQPDGKLVAAGRAYVSNPNDDYFALARYNSDGSPDLDFGIGGDGQVLTNFTAGGDEAKDLAIQTDGKIVASGQAHSSNDVALARYNPDGTLDTTFDGDGLVMTDLGGFEDGRSVAIQVDGRIVVGGGSPRSFTLLRYDTYGNLDNSFGIGGVVTTNFGVQVNAITIQSDNKIVATGSGLLQTDSVFAVARFVTDVLAPPRCQGERFTDVCPEDFFYDPVLQLNDDGIISGYNTVPPCDNVLHVSCFKPFNNMTRGQISKVVSLAAGFSEPVSGQTFEDVPPTNTFYPYVERMASCGIIGGYPCGSPGEDCIPPDNRPYFRSGV